MKTIALLSAVLFIWSSVDALAANGQVNVYSARKEALIKPLLDRFTTETGIKVNLITGKGDALLTRLVSEGRRSPADVLFTSDAGRLYKAQEAKVFQPIKSDLLEARIPVTYRDKSGYWFGLSLRSRVIVYDPAKVKSTELSTYEDLAMPKWKGKVCIRSSGNIYNQSLVSSLLSHHGEKETGTWLNGLVKNFARPPKGGDRDQIKAVVSGVCDLAVVNSYYLGAMLNSNDESQKQIAQSVALFWPNQSDRGAHVNISGAGVTLAAKNKKNAIKLIEFLTSPQSQAWYAEANNEYPVVSNIKISPTLESWGEFKADTISMGLLGEKNADAVRAMDRAGWK